MQIKKLTCKFFLSLVTTGIILAGSPSPLLAEEITPKPKEFPLSIKDCVKITLKNNLELLREGLTPQIRQTQVAQEQAAFDVTSTMEVSKGVDENRGPTELAGAAVSRTEDIFVNLGTKKKLTGGATLELDFNNREFRSNSRFVTINPYYETNLALKLTQPLLENLGAEVNEAPITIAVNNRLISILELRQKIIDITSEAQKIYWDVVFKHQNLKVKELFSKQAQDLLNINQAKVAVGTLSKLGIEILETRSSVATRQAEVFTAKDELKDAEDKLKNITNLVYDIKSWQVTIIPTDQPTTKIINPSLEKSIEIALKSRPDYALLQKELLNKKINLRLAENKRLPSLDLIGQWGLNSLGNSYGDNLDRLADGNFRTWLVGINLEVPWGNRWANNNYLEKKLATKQTQLEIEAVAQKIVLEIREAVRQIQTDLKRIQMTKIAQEMEEKSLATVEEMRKVGEKGFTDHTVLEYQTQLTDAKTKHLKAIIDYNQSLIDFEVKKGTFLEKNGIAFEKLFPDT